MAFTRNGPNSSRHEATLPTRRHPRRRDVPGSHLALFLLSGEPPIGERVGLLRSRAVLHLDRSGPLFCALWLFDRRHSSGSSQELELLSRLLSAADVPDFSALLSRVGIICLLLGDRDVNFPGLRVAFRQTNADLVVRHIHPEPFYGPSRVLRLLSAATAPVLRVVGGSPGGAASPPAFPGAPRLRRYSVPRGRPSFGGVPGAARAIAFVY